MPPHLVRNTASGTHMVGGASPRHCMQCTCSTQELPLFTQVINRFLASQHSSHVYTTFVIRAGCQSEVHRDVRNGPTKALAQQLTPTEPGEGLWIQDVAGDIIKHFKGVALRGTVVSLQQVQEVVQEQLYRRLPGRLWHLRVYLPVLWLLEAFRVLVVERRSICHLIPSFSTHVVYSMQDTALTPIGASS